MQVPVALALALLLAASGARANYLANAEPNPSPQPPAITPFAFNQPVHENQRSSVLCTISSGDLPVNISWLKDGQLLTPQLAQAKRIIIKPDSDQSTLKFASVRLEHAGNYTCVARNRAGLQTHAAQLVVHGEPRWLHEPRTEPIVTTRGQTIVVDCQTTGWPRPQQSWQIKTHDAADYEPLLAAGRISLAANGSLVIRNIDKSDEANYLCRSSNGIGKAISYSTSLKVTVPAHFEASRQQMSVVRKQSQVQLRCDAHGDEPLTIEWYRNKQRLQPADAEPRYAVHNKPLQNGLISLLLIKQAQRQDNSLFECVTRNSAGKDRLAIELVVQEEPDNIQELQATQINSRSVTLVWPEPYDGRSAITNYMFQYKKLAGEQAAGASQSLADFELMDSAAPDAISHQPNQQRPGGASLAADDWQQAQRLLLQASNATSGGVKSVTIEKLDPASKYVLRALAVNAIGQSRFSQPMEFSTEEEAPESGPTGIRASAVNSTSIQVSWNEIPRSRQLGRIHGYYIGYRVSNANSSAQNFLYKPYVINDLLPPPPPPQQEVPPASPPPATAQRLETTIHDLRRDTAYEITVVAFNSRGSGPSSDFVVCRTNEMEAPKPVRVQIRRESNESIFIEWQRDPTDQNPIDDYVLYQEKNSEWLQVRLPGNQSQYKAPGLSCGTRYQFYMIAHNKLGKSLPSEVVAASTSGALPVVPTRTQLLKMLNATCLSVNLNAFQDNGCRIRTFTVRYKIERSSGTIHAQAALPGAAPSMALSNTNGFAATNAALTAASQLGGKTIPVAPAATNEWITIRPKSNSKHQRANDEDKIEYLCGLDPDGEYTIHVSASNDVGRSEIEYTVLMSSDELRYSAFKEMIDATFRQMLEFTAGIRHLLAYISPVIIFLLVGLFVSLMSLILYTAAIKYYHKLVIFQNQVRATRRAKRDEKRRRKLNNARLSKKVEGWVDEYEYENDDDDDGDDEDDDDDTSTTATSSNPMSHHNHMGHPHKHFAHYHSNLASSVFDSSSIDSPCNNKATNGSFISTASTNSIHGRFQCLNSKQYVKMNEYSMLPSISATLSPHTDIYGTVTNPTTAPSLQLNGAGPAPGTDANNNSLYYSTLRRTNMQTYLPQQQPNRAQQSPQQHGSPHRQPSSIYGYYMPPSASQVNQQQVVTTANEAANSIFVPPQQIIYSAPNIRRQPVFL